jgi:glycerophosphoryl diester phosphodiesterase
MLFRSFVFSLFLSVVVGLLPVMAQPIVIAHRGASGYLPEHTLEAAAYAHALGVDFIEQDVVLSKDNVLVVTHDIHVDTTTDVAVRYPDRKRSDGRYYAIDFTWAELKELTVRERFEAKTGLPVFPERFPSRAHDGAAFRLCTFDEQVTLIRGLNRSTGRDVGIYPEFKAPAWHRAEGKDVGQALIAALTRHGYTESTHRAYVQCFDPGELERLRTSLKTKLKLIQLIGDNADNESTADYTAMRTPAGLKKIAIYAQGIGPHLSHILIDHDPDGSPRLTSLVADAHELGLSVHPYTFRADRLPRGVPTLDALLTTFVDLAKIDGLFIDHPDAAVRRLSEDKRARAR